MTDPANSTGGNTHQDQIFARAEELVMTDPPALVQEADEMISAVDAHGSIGDLLNIRRIVAMGYSRTNQFEESLALCAEARSMDGAESAPVELARLQLATMEPLANLDRISDAIDAGKDALETLESAGETILAARAAQNIGATLAMTGSPEEGLTYLQQARSYVTDNPQLIGQIETNMGIALTMLDKFEESEAAFERAVESLSAQEGASWPTAIVEGSLAFLAARQGDINRSLQHYEKTRRLLEMNDAFGDIGRVNAEEGVVLATAGLTAVAMETFPQALTLLETHGPPHELATARIAYARILTDAGRNEDARQALESVEDLFEREQQPDLYNQLLAIRAKLAIAGGDAGEAQACIDSGTALVAERPMQLLRWRMIEADHAFSAGDSARAKSILQDALTRAGNARISPLLTMVHESLAAIARAAGDHDEANEHARQAIESAEAIRGTIQADRVRESWHKDRLDVYTDLYAALLSNDDRASQAEAFGLAERIRGRMLFDTMTTHDFEADAQFEGDGRDQAIVQERDGHRRWLNWMYSSIAEGAEPATEQLDEMQEREIALARLNDRLSILKHHGGFLTPMSRDEVQQRIARTDVLVSYLMVGDRLTVQVVDDEGVHALDNLAREADVSGLVAKLQFQMMRALAHGFESIPAARQARLCRDADRLLAELYQLLVAPVAQLLQGKTRVVFIPTGALYSVPFSALKDGNDYLIDRVEVAIGPSASILNMMDLGGNVRTDFAQPMVVGVADELAPELDREAREVAERFPSAAVFVGHDAHVSAVLDAMVNADLVHFACHGRFDPVHPRTSGLRLADGWLTLDRIIEQRLRSPLVMLTGCETGKVRVERGDDLLGMIVAFIKAGAAGLVTTLWKTHDASAKALIGSFYAGIGHGLTPGEALRASQLQTREDYRHPAFWAPFTGVLVREKGSGS